MLLDIIKFYRINSWIKNLGIGVIGILNATLYPNLFHSLLILLQLALLQMHSFSMNDFFDFKVWKEKNYISTLMRSGKMKKISVIFLLILPLIFLDLILFSLSSPYSFLLLLYILIFFFYQSPSFRFKNHWLSYLIITPLGLGVILFLYPYLFFSNNLTLEAIIFSIIFYSYIAFHEIIHMIAHLKKDKIRTLPYIIGKKRTLKISIIFLILPIVVCLIALLLDLRANLIFIGTLFFSFLRIFKVKKLDINKTNFNKLRNKFFGIYEGIYYIAFLSVIRPIFLNHLIL